MKIKEEKYSKIELYRTNILRSDNLSEKEQKKRGGCLKNVLIVIGVLILFGACSAVFSSDDEEENTASEPQERKGIVQTDDHEESAEEPAEEEPSDVISIAESFDYVMQASLMDEPYVAKIDGEVQNFNPADEKHYRIQLEHHGGITGSKNLDRFKEIIENIEEENAEYDYLVLEAIRENDDELERLDYSRFNPEQAQELLNQDEVNDDVFESIADFHIHGLTDVNVGFDENIIGVNETISFAEFTVTIRNVYLEDGDARIDMLFRNDSDPSGLRFISALGMDVYQGDTRLEETSGEVESGMGGNSGIYYKHDRGIETSVDLSYGPINEEDSLRIVFTPMLYDFEDSQEVIIELN